MPEGRPWELVFLFRSQESDTERDSGRLRGDGGLEEVYRRETTTDASDGGLQISDSELTKEIDDVCAILEALQKETDHPKVEAALSEGVGSVWRASVLERLESNTDIRMITTSGPTGTVIHGPGPVDYKRERGKSR